MSSPESIPATSLYAAADRARLLAAGRDAIVHGLRTGLAPPIDRDAWPRHLLETRATFVTLRREGELRGCIGSLEPNRSLVADVVENAVRAAFHDPRFPPVREDELGAVELHISILGERERLEVSSESDLVARLRPGIDGLVLRDGRHRATFLPAVWESLPSPVDFVRELKRKAGLPADHWSPQIELERYGVESIH